MHAGNPVLIDFIQDAIRRNGPVTFDWFMEQALYHPELGYYSSGRCAIGRHGDYFTNVSVGPLFGQVLASQFSEMWRFLGRPDIFVIVEQGAHHGDFARDVLKALAEKNPDCFSTVRYTIIEPFPILRAMQQKALADFSGTVIWEESLDTLDPFCGVHFSNELLDAMPVRLISRSENGWLERRVGESGEEFGFVATPVTDGELQSNVKAIPDGLPVPYETEINLATSRWVDRLAQKLIRGYVLTVDYGYSHPDFFAPERSNGTLRCYSKHRIVPSPFIAVGETDITAHVNWTNVGLRAEEHGLRVAGFTDQYHFVTGVATTLMLEQFEAAADPRTRRALPTLLHPELLGKAFQFLALTRDVDPDLQLSGLKFARNARARSGSSAV